MNTPLDWTTVSDDPNNREAKAAVRAWLKTAQRVHADNELLGHIEGLVAGRRRPRQISSKTARPPATTRMR